MLANPHTSTWNQGRAPCVLRPMLSNWHSKSGGCDCKGESRRTLDWQAIFQDSLVRHTDKHPGIDPLAGSVRSVAFLCRFQAALIPTQGMPCGSQHKYRFNLRVIMCDITMDAGYGCEILQPACSRTGISDVHHHSLELRCQVGGEKYMSEEKMRKGEGRKARRTSGLSWRQQAIQSSIPLASFSK